VAARLNVGMEHWEKSKKKLKNEENTAAAV
jgi:hypothetical protein